MVLLQLLLKWLVAIVHEAAVFFIWDFFKNFLPGYGVNEVWRRIRLAYFHYYLIQHGMLFLCEWLRQLYKNTFSIIHCKRKTMEEGGTICHCTFIGRSTKLFAAGGLRKHGLQQTQPAAATVTLNRLTLEESQSIPAILNLYGDEMRNSVSPWSLAGWQKLFVR